MSKVLFYRKCPLYYIPIIGISSSHCVAYLYTTHIRYARANNSLYLYHLYIYYARIYSMIHMTLVWICVCVMRTAA